jgi:formate dehydrogenase iron-sulfur subunit
MTRVFVPRDSGALSMGANDVAHAIAREAARRGVDISIVRNGSRGMYWLEPLVEVEGADGRRAWGPVTVESVPSLFDADFHNFSGASAGVQANQSGRSISATPLSLGLTEEIPWLSSQERLTFARVGIVDPVSPADYELHGGNRGLRRALAMTGPQIVEEVVNSGLRGRGGAAFPTGIKWNTVLSTGADRKYIVCNADEGDSGTFSDRMIMEGDPFVLIEGMTIAGIAVGATMGYIYLRSEYPDAQRVLNEAIAAASHAGWLGGNVLGSGKSFQLEVRMGAGAYICGEETALLDSLEGKRGMVRPKPPLPAIEGLFGKPTVINNVISLASVPIILDRGAGFYRDYGLGRSRGTLPMQLAGNIRYGGLVEKAFGVTLRQLLYDYGGGSRSGRPIRAVQVGGPLGAYLPESQFDTPLDYEAFLAINAMVGHGGIVAFDDTVDMAHMARYAMEFCAIESCGKCTPCRIGSVRGTEVIDKLVTAKNAGDEAGVEKNVVLLRDLCETMVSGSLCAMGGMTPFPVVSALNHFPEDFGISPIAAQVAAT